MKIEVDETDLDEIADIHSRMNNHTDEQIRDETVRYLEKRQPQVSVKAGVHRRMDASPPFSLT